MLSSVRKDLEELEARLDSLGQQQAQLEAAIGAARVHLTNVVQGEINNLETGIARNFEMQSQWLAARGFEARAAILEQGTLDKSEVLAASAAFETRQHGQTESLRAQFAEQFEALHARQDETAWRLAEFESAWRAREELEIDDASESAVVAWSEAVGARLKKFGPAQGMPRSFAWQLLQELKELTELNRQFGDKTRVWDESLDELQRALFAPERALSWTSLTPHNATSAQRRELRVLETAVAQLRSHSQENLRRATGICPLEIVPRISPFDASLHESNEFLEVPTANANKHNVILSVEQMGFQKISTGGEVLLLRPARVRRYVLQNETAPAPDAATPPETFAPETFAPETFAPEESSPMEEDVPRVSGQL